MKTFVALSVHFSLLALAWSQTTTKQDIEAMKASANTSNTHLSRALSLQASADLGSATYAALVAPTAEPATDGPTTTDIAISAAASQRKYDEGYLILKGNDLLVKGSIGAGIVFAAATGGTSLVASAIGEGASMGLGSVEELYQKAAQDSIRRDLKSHLDQYAVKYGQDAYSQLTATTDPATFRNIIEQKTGSIFGTELDNLPQSQQDIVNHFYERQIDDLMKAGFSGLSNYQALQQSEIEQNRKNIKGLALTFTEFADSTNDQLGAIFESQKQLQSGLQTLNTRIGNTEQGVAFMQQVMFSNLKPSEQLGALRQGMFSNITDDQRRDLEEKIAVVAKREQLNTEIGTYLTGASEIANIAKNLGVDSSIVKVADTAIAVGTQAFNAVTAFSSGNYLSAASSLSNLMGIGGPDVAAERQQQIMNMLGKMYTKLDVIDQKVDKLVQGQQLILQTQQVILDSIGQLSEQIQGNQVQLISQLHDLHNDVLVNRQIIADQASLHYGNCRDLVIDAVDGSTIIDTNSGKYPDWNQFQRLYTGIFSSLQACTHLMGDTRDINQDFQSTFWLESYSNTVEAKVDDYIHSVYLPAWNLLQASPLRVDNKSLGQRISSLLAPMQDVSSLDGKLAIVEEANPPRFKKAGGLSELMTTSLATSVVMAHDRYIVDIHYYYTLLGAQDQLRSLSDLYKGDNIRDTGYRQLMEALSMTDIAIAQQALVSGDSLLPIMASGVLSYRSSTDTTEQKTYKSMIGLLANDSILASNLITYIFRGEVLSKCNLLTYDIALSFVDAAALNSCTDDSWTFHFSDHEEKNGLVLKVPKGWSVDVGGVLYAMPSSQALLDGRLIYSDELYKLLGWRQRLLQEIGSYQVYLDVAAKRRPEINSIILNEFLGRALPRLN